MSISAISHVSSAASEPVNHKPAPAPAQSSSAHLPEDTVSLSSAAQKSSKAGDVDHDGDSH